MSSIEAIDEYNIKLTFDVGAEEFEKGLRHSYNKNKNYFVIQGFRKGKAPRKFIEKQYGEDIFFEDAINFVLGGAYEQAIKEQNLHLQRKLQSLSQINGCAKLLLAFLRLKHDTDANYVGFFSKILDVTVSTSQNRTFEAEKWFIFANVTSAVDL